MKVAWDVGSRSNPPDKRESKENWFDLASQSLPWEPSKVREIRNVLLSGDKATRLRVTKRLDLEQQSDSRPSTMHEGTRFPTTMKVSVG